MPASAPCACGAAPAPAWPKHNGAVAPISAAARINCNMYLNRSSRIIAGPFASVVKLCAPTCKRQEQLQIGCPGLIVCRDALQVKRKIGMRYEVGPLKE